MITTQTLSTLAETAASRLDELSSLVQRRIHQGVKEYDLTIDPALAVSESKRVRATLSSTIRALSGSEEPGDEFLAEAVMEAKTAAQAGVDLYVLIRTYRVAQSATWDVLIDETTRVVPDAAEQLEVQKWISGLQHRWNDVVVAAVIDAYQTEQHRFFHESRDRILRAQLRDFISGRQDSVPATTFPFGGTHVAVVIWGDQPQQVIEHLSQAFEAQSTLAVESTSGAFLAWFAIAPDLDMADTLTRLQLPDGAHIALGPTDAGPAGFRRSHQRAWWAYRIGRWSRASTTMYSDIALESVFASDMQAARDLVVQKLGPLDLGDPRTEVLCETLAAYFAAGCNAVAAAAALNVHERTVSYRLKSIEERLQSDVIKDREDLIVALRLHGLLKTIRSTGSGQQFQS